MTHTNITPDEIATILAYVASTESDAGFDKLQKLYPGDGQSYNNELWLAIFTLYGASAFERAVGPRSMMPTGRDLAAAMIDELYRRAQRNSEARELLEWLESQGIETVDRKREARRLESRAKGMREGKTIGATERKKVTWRDVPKLMETLSCGDDKEQKKTLELLCPCRNRLYDRELWLAIFDAHERGDSGQIRDQAGHAITTLLERARTDPRSQELVLWIADQNVTDLPLASRVPEWRPNLRGGDGLYIPRFEPTSRSKANRRR